MDKDILTDNYHQEKEVYLHAAPQTAVTEFKILKLQLFY